MMDQLTRELSVPFKRNGSMVLAFGEEDAGTLQILLDRGIQNGVPGVEIVSGDRARGVGAEYLRECDRGAGRAQRRHCLSV